MTGISTDVGAPAQGALGPVRCVPCILLKSVQSVRRRRIRQDLETGDIETLPLEHPDPDQLERLQTEHTSKEVRAVLGKLPDRARMALVLRYYGDMSYEEIAETLGVRRAFVGVLLLRARHQLREALTEAGAANLRGAAAGGKP